MLSFFVLSAAVSTATTPGIEGGTADWTRVLLQLLAIVFIFYLFFVRPQQKSAKERVKMLSSLNVGDEVLVGGFIGKIKELTNDAEVVVELDKNVNVKVLRSFINQVMIEKSSETLGKKTKK